MVAFFCMGWGFLSSSFVLIICFRVFLAFSREGTTKSIGWKKNVARPEIRHLFLVVTKAEL